MVRYVAILSILICLTDFEAVGFAWKLLKSSTRLDMTDFGGATKPPLNRSSH